MSSHSGVIAAVAAAGVILSLPILAHHNPHRRALAARITELDAFIAERERIAADADRLRVEMNENAARRVPITRDPQTLLRELMENGINHRVGDPELTGGITRARVVMSGPSLSSLDDAIAVVFDEGSGEIWRIEVDARGAWSAEVMVTENRRPPSEAPSTGAPVPTPWYAFLNDVPMADVSVREERLRTLDEQLGPILSAEGERVWTRALVLASDRRIGVDAFVDQLSLEREGCSGRYRFDGVRVTLELEGCGEISRGSLEEMAPRDLQIARLESEGARHTIVLEPIAPRVALAR